MSKRIILLTKDAMGKFYIPIYGNKTWNTPNIDELAKKGTVFNRHYTAAPSSAMSYYCMFTEQFSMESKMRTYRVLSKEERFQGETLFDKARKLGYSCHVVWETSWNSEMKNYSECYGVGTEFHPLDGIKQKVGVHSVNKDELVYDTEEAANTCRKIEECINSICNTEDDVFVWMHLPHVLYGCTGYGTDIDWFDKCIGFIRKYFRDDDIFISADHGNMNGAHGKLGYAFDVYEQAASIPLITPRIDGFTNINYPTSNVDLYELIFERRIIKREFVYSDSAYYAQLHRKLAIVHGDYKYIYTLDGDKEELYDVVYDPNETQNLMFDKQYDTDRGVSGAIKEMYFYPNWDKVIEERAILREQLHKVLRKPKGNEYLRALYEKYGKMIKRRYVVYKKRMCAKLNIK